MSYGDWIYQQSPQGQADAQAEADAQKKADADKANGVYNARNLNSSGGSSNLAVDGDNTGIQAWAHGMFGKAGDVDMPNPDWATTQYGGSNQAANSNFDMLQRSGDEGLSADLTTGRSLYANQVGASYGSAQRGTANDVAGTSTVNTGVGAQEQAYGDIGNWLAQGPGPSVAEAQLRRGNDQNVANTMAMAASGRGQGGSAASQQQAMWSGATSGQQTNEAAAQLRAQEAQAWKQQELAGMQAQAGIGSNITGAGQNQQNLGLSYNQLAANQQQNAGSTLLGAMGQGQQNQQYFYNLGQQQLANQTQAASTLEGQRMADTVEAQKANQASFYQHQSAQTGFWGGLLGGASSMMGGGK